MRERERERKRETDKQGTPWLRYLNQSGTARIYTRWRHISWGLFFVPLSQRLIQDRLSTRGRPHPRLAPKTAWLCRLRVLTDWPLTSLTDRWNWKLPLLYIFRTSTQSFFRRPTYAIHVAFPLFLLTLKHSCTSSFWNPQTNRLVKGQFETSLRIINVSNTLNHLTVCKQMINSK